MTKMLTIHRLERPLASDFCHGVEGELAFPPVVVCDSNCGCERAHAGMGSHCASTTLMVRNVELSQAQLVELAADYLIKTGFVRASSRDAALGAVEEWVGSLVDVASDYDEGTVLRPFYDCPPGVQPSAGEGDWVYVEIVP